MHAPIEAALDSRQRALKRFRRTKAQLEVIDEAIYLTLGRAVPDRIELSRNAGCVCRG